MRRAAPARLPSAYTRFGGLLALRGRLAELFRRPARQSRPPRLGLEAMEDRLVPNAPGYSVVINSPSSVTGVEWQRITYTVSYAVPSGDLGDGLVLFADPGFPVCGTSGVNLTQASGTYQFTFAFGLPDYIWTGAPSDWVFTEGMHFVIYNPVKDYGAFAAEDSINLYVTHAEQPDCPALPPDLTWKKCAVPCDPAVPGATCIIFVPTNEPCPASAAPVRYADGAIVYTTTDLAADGFGTTWGQGRSWSNAAGYAGGSTQGNGWVDTALPHLVPEGLSVAAVFDATTAVWYDQTGSGYAERHPNGSALAFDALSGLYELTNADGSVVRFYGFDPTLPADQAGTFASYTDAAGNTVEATAHDGDGRVTEVQRVAGTGPTAVTESLVYTYGTSGAAAGLLTDVTLRRKVGTGAWATVQSVGYTYYDGTADHGNAGDLMLAVVKDAAGTPTDTSYYRYYQAGDAHGYAGGLQYVFGPAAYAQLTAALGTGVDALTDAQVDDFADNYFEYDGSRRVTREVAAGAGCSACAGGQGEYTYAYTASSNAPGPNSWAKKTVTGLPDGGTDTVYTNSRGQVMLTAHLDAGAVTPSVTYYRYDADGRVVLQAEPSAVTGFSDSYADLVHYVSGNAQYLSDAAGLLTAYTYGASTTATSSTAGDALGYQKAVDLLHGETGTAVPQSSQTYIARTAGGQDSYFLAASAVYRNADGTGAQTTTYAYTWQGSTAQPASVTTTLPTVTTAQNGSNSATAVTTVYDAQGRPVWAKDAAGFLNYVAYDPATGAVVKTIVDVDTTLTGTFAGLPSGWSTPSGGGLHLTTAFEVDDQGRPTKVTHPDGVVDYTVYDDAAHEVRSYAGWNTATNRPSGPTVVTREDRAGGYTETLTMSAAPAVSSGRPTGAESISAVQSLSRSYRNDAGQVVYSDEYFYLGGLAYSTSTSLGTAGVNFDRTSYVYDAGGRPAKTVSPAGTITRTVYDGQGRAVSEWVGTDDTPTTGYWSPTNLTGTDMAQVRAYEYDGGGAGDGNLTRVTEYPGGGAAARVTETYYDWRDRAVATKSGVEASEDTAVNRPITYVDYDNLGQVTKTRVYDGDGVTVTSSGGVPVAPSSGLLRAQTTTGYDELGRAYRTDTYSVDPSSGTVGSDTLNSQTWYDASGQVIKTAAPGGLVQKTAYDGAGRAVATYLSDGGGDTGYSDADDVTGDTVLEQAETVYDAGGKVLVSITRQRMHDASGTGALGTPSAGVAARVSYAGYYYDAGGRVTDVVDVGTNGGSAWTRPGSVPARSDTALVTSTAYAADAVQAVRLTGAVSGGTFTLTVGANTTAGIAYNASAATVQAALAGLASVGSGNVAVTDAAGGGWEVRFTGGLAGQYRAMMSGSPAGLSGGGMPAVVIGVVSAGGDTGGAASSTDPLGRTSRTYADLLGRTVRTVENFVDGAVSAADDKTTDYTYGPAGMTSLTARTVGGGGQTTAWVYGVAGAVYSNDVVGATQHPDPTTGAASGSEQETVTVNALGQVVTSTDRNGTVHTLAYDALGRVVADAVTTLGAGVDGAVRRVETAYDGQGHAYLVTNFDAASGGSVVNQVRRAFNGLGQMVTEWQAHGGTVDTATSPAVQYAYAEMPSGANQSRLTSMTYPGGYVLTFNYASGLDANISRLSSLSDSTGTLEAYRYLGAGTVVIRSHPQVGAAGLDLTLVKQGLEGDGDAGDQYAGLDRFGRVVDQRWLDANTGAATDRFQYGYDRGGNRLFRGNLVNGNFGELYGYDALNQLASFARGELDGTRTAITGTAATTSDWDYDALGNWSGVAVDGGSPQTRTANAQNEITSIGGATTPTYDANGNMTGDETGRKFVYDAWNRLVAVTDALDAVLVEYTYDGLNRRVTRDDGTVTNLYYSAQWQVLEEQQGGDTTDRYVWSPVYVDALVLRDRATTTPGTLDERLWVQQDANWNVTAVVDGSGAVVERYAYDPFGRLINYSYDYSVEFSSSLFNFAFAFQGMEVDPISGLNTSRARSGFSATLGVWISPDPLGLIPDANFYRFVSNNPVNTVDPSGLDGIGVYGGVGGELGIGALGVAAGYAMGGGIFWGGNQPVTASGIRTYTAVAVAGNNQACFPVANNGALPARILGAAVGWVPIGVFYTNATSANDLAGQFTTYTVNLPVAGLVGANVSVAVDPVTDIYQVGIGPSLGFGWSGSVMPTWTDLWP